MEELNTVLQEILNTRQEVTKVLICTEDGSPITGISRDASEQLDAILPTYSAGVASMVGIAKSYFRRTLNDDPDQYLVWQGDHVILSTKAMKLVLVAFADVADLKNISALSNYLEQKAHLIAGIFASEKVKEPLTARIQKLIPEARAVLILTPTGSPISTISSEIDEEELSSVCAGISLSTTIFGGKEGDINITSGDKYTLFLCMFDQTRILAILVDKRVSRPIEDLIRIIRDNK